MQKAAPLASESYLALLNYRTAPLQHVLLLADSALNRKPKAKMFAQLETNIRFNSISQYRKVKQSFNRSDLLCLIGVQQIKKNKSLVQAKTFRATSTPWKWCWLFLLQGSVVTNSGGTRGGGFTVVDCCPKGKSRASGAGWFPGHSSPTSVGLITTGGWWCWYIQCKGPGSASKHLDVSHPHRGWGRGCAPVTPSQGFVPMGTVDGLEKKAAHSARYPVWMMWDPGHPVTPTYC